MIALLTQCIFSLFFLFTSDVCTSYNSTTVTCETWVNELHEHEHMRYGLLLEQCRTTYSTSHFIYTHTMYKAIM
jgi:hypothetical protein